MNQIEMLSDQVPESFVKEWYSMGSEGHVWFDWRFRVFVKQLESLEISLHNNYNILDIGCGQGIMRNQIESISNWVVNGCDTNMEGLSMNTSDRGRTLYYDIHNRIPVFKDSYDGLLVYDVLEHIEDTCEFIESALFHVKKGGWIFVNVPSLNVLFSHYDIAVGHHRRYNKKTLAEELSGHSIVIKDMRYWGFSMIPFLFARKYMYAVTKKNIVKRGFTAPNKLIDELVRKIMGIETSIQRSPYVGTSLMAACIKSDS
ncbi:MAG: methyltransferase domain-containing protein [Nitrospirae bacterium]|nr:methyltransferase domain-containing protein [Nitrospirota bacterium]